MKTDPSPNRDDNLMESAQKQNMTRVATGKRRPNPTGIMATLNSQEKPQIVGPSYRAHIDAKRLSEKVADDAPQLMANVIPNQQKKPRRMVAKHDSSQDAPNLPSKPAGGKKSRNYDITPSN